ncbi:MAG: hypothetical protein ABR527_02775 [Gemmatimonadota bacterium]
MGRRGQERLRGKLDLQRRAAAALMGDPRALLTRDLPGALGDPWSLGFLGGAILFAAYLWGRAALGQLARP